MGGKSWSRDAELAKLAARQQGVAALWQLLGLGFTRRMVETRLAAGRLYVVFRGVYSLTPHVTPRGRFMAAALSYGPEAVLSHRAAAAVWELGGWPAGPIDVTVPRFRRQQRGIRLHTAAVKRSVEDGFPVTTPSRTLIDLASRLSTARLEEAVERAERLHLLDVEKILEHLSGRRGATKLRAILEAWIDPEPARSELERAIRNLCEAHDIPMPSQNVSVHGEDVDAYWEATNTVAELDSYQWHRTRRTFERDREKAARLERHGVRVLRFTWRQVTQTPELVAAAIKAR